MAISAAVGLVTAVGAGIAYGFTAVVVFTGFALGAGFSALSRALIPKPDLGTQMRGTTVTTRDPAGPRKLIYGRVRAGGNTVFIDHSGSDNKYLHLVIVFASHEIQGYDEIWFNDNKIWTASSGFLEDWGTYVTIDRKFGTAGQAASSSLVSASSYWTNDHKLSGIAYIAFRLEWNQDKFPQGVPNITAVIRGKKVYDPRTQVIAYSQNPALCVRDYLLDSSYGLGESSSSINYDALEAAADLCEEQVALAAGGTQDRYQCNGIIETSNQIKSNIEQLLSSMGGKLTYSGGEYFIDGAEYRAPTVTIDESVIISSIKTQTKQSRRSIYNGVKGTFISEEKNYKVLDYPAQISSTYATEDGDPIFLDMPLPFVSNNLQAQRLAKIALLKSRQQTVISMTVNLAGLKIKIGDTISVNYDKLGYSGKVFEVIGYELAMSSSGEMGVQLECIETASAIYDWTTSDEEDFLSGGELDLYDGRTVENVTGLSLTEIGLRGPDGGLSSSVQLAWTAPDDAFIEYYKIRYNKSGTTDYFEVQSRETNVLISGLDINSNYDFRVQAENLIGVSSTGTSLLNQELNGDQTAPEKPTNTSATGGIQTITAEWSNPDDIDFKHVEVFVNTTNSRPATPTALVDGEEYIVTGLTGAQTRYFWLKSVDFSGNKSAATASFNAASVVAGSSDIGDDAVGSDQIADGAIDIAAFAAGINPVQVVSTLPATAAQGDMAFLTTDNKLYRYDGSAWTLSVDGADVTNGTLPANAIVANSLTAGQIAAGAISTDELAANAVTAAKIQAASITVDKLSGDVSEVFSFGVYKAPAVSITSSEATFGEFTIPAPDATISKYGMLTATMQFTSNSPTGPYALEVDFERKSTGTTSGTSLGSIVGSGSLNSFFYYVEVSGNHLKEVDSFGGIATSQTSPSAIKSPYAVEYQSSTDRTRIIYSDISATLTSGTLYYNADKWTSSGTWLTYAGSARRYPVPDISGNNFIALTLHQPLAKSDGEENYRIRSRTQGFSGTSVSITSINGQIQLLT